MKLSVIVPVYNVEKYIDKCLKSLVSQTIDNYEIIIVVDGSKDNSIEIVKKYKEKYPKLIRYYETENKGLSAARNYGLTKAKGKYIGFVDSDDYVEKNMFKEMYNFATNKNNDIVICNYSKVTEQEQKKVDLKINDNEKKHHLILKAKPYAWNKIYKKELFEKYSLSFPDGLIFEDIYTIYSLMLKNDKIGYINEYFYNYTINRPDSIMKTKNRNDEHVLMVLEQLNNYCKQNALWKENFKTIQEINIRHIFYRLNEMKHFNSKSKNIKFVIKAFNFMNKNFKGWRKKSVYANKINALKKIEILWILLIITWRK